MFAAPEREELAVGAHVVAVLRAERATGAERLDVDDHRDADARRPRARPRRRSRCPGRPRDGKARRDRRRATVDAPVAEPERRDRDDAEDERAERGRDGAS